MSYLVTKANAGKNILMKQKTTTTKTKQISYFCDLTCDFLFVLFQLNAPSSTTRWPHSTTGKLEMSCHTHATRSWLRIAHQNSNSWFCWRKTKYRIRTRSMLRFQTCKSSQDLCGKEILVSLWAKKILISNVFELLLNSDVDMYRKNNAIVVMVNGVEIPKSNLPYLHPSGFCLFF